MPSGPDPSGDFGQGRHIVDRVTGESVDVVGGALKTTSGGGGGAVDQGAPNTAANAWPVKLTDAAGVNQAAVTAAGDVKVTLDDEQPKVKIVSGDGSGEVATVLSGGALKISGSVSASVPGVATSAIQTDGTQLGRICDATIFTRIAKVTSAGNLQVSISAAAATVSVLGTEADDSASGALSVLVLPARANAAAPTWLESRREPLSVDLAGSLRVRVTGLDQYTPVSGRLPVDGSGVTQPVSIAGSSTTTVPAQTSVGTAAIQLLASNASRKRAMVQNTGTTVIKLTLGATDPTQTAYHVALAPGSAADDGKGGVFIEEKWTGRIAAISSAASGTVVVTELT